MTLWSEDSLTDTAYAEIQVASSSRWEDAVAPFTSIQSIRVDALDSDGLVTNVQLLQQDSFAPQFVEAPAVRSVQTGTIVLDAVLETEGVICAVAVEAGDMPPTALQVANSLDARNKDTPSGCTSTAGQVRAIWSISNLPENIYDVYVTTSDQMPLYPVLSQVTWTVLNVDVSSGVYTSQAYDQVNGNVTDLISEEEISSAVVRHLAAAIVVLLI